MKRLLAGTAILLAASTAHADYLGLLPGRTAAPDDTTLSVDAGLLIEGDVQNIGLRANYRLSDAVLVYGNIGLAEFLNEDGASFGAGAYYYLPDQSFLQSFDVALKGYGQFGALGDIDTFALSGEVLVSPKEPLSANGLSWYAHGGLGYLDVSFDVPSVVDIDGVVFDTGGGDISDDSVELVLGGGLTLPIGPGTAFGGIEFFDELFFGVGYRYDL